VCNGLVEIGGLFSQKELESLYDSMFYLKGFPSGRAIWQLGTETVERLGADSLCNCWHVLCNNLESFCFAFNELMLGGGVGFNILPEYVYELPRVKFDPPIARTDSPDCDLIVTDNREGWVELLRRVLEAYFITGKPLAFSTQCIRSAGKIIHSFGGVASGSEPLVRGIMQITKILSKRHGEKLRPIDCMDLMNIVGTIVVSGNVRRSSQIAIGHPFDLQFLQAKNWNKGIIPNWRKMSNNTVATSNIEALPNEYWEPFDTDGECYGLININNCRRFGRLRDGVDYRPDYGVVGTNPCGEASLEDKEPCNLAETILPNIEDVEEWIKVMMPLYKATKTIANFHYLDSATEDVVHRNYRVGVSLSGFMAAEWARDPEVLNKGYRALEEADVLYSALLGVPTSKKLTTVKPSGTVSLLPYGCTPGMHAAFHPHLIRRIRFAGNDPLVQTCHQHGYDVEPELNQDGSHNTDTMVVSFPMQYGSKAIIEGEMTVIDELETQKMLQTHWADQSVSCSHYFNRDEVGDIKDWLNENYEEHVKTCSFMHAMDHGFKQAPLEKIDYMTYERMCDKVTPITEITDDHEIDLADNLECAGGSCPAK
jgi:adenosylcobalamin-dependent ribonucleoside-triphosphate reductase